MPMELHYAPIDENATISLDILIVRLTDSGFKCQVEPDTKKDMYWVIFDGHLSTLLASVTDGQFVSGTLQVVFDTMHALNTEGESLVEPVDAVMRRCGYSAGEDEV